MTWTRWACPRGAVTWPNFMERRHQRVVVAHLLHAVGDLAGGQILGIEGPPLPIKAGDVVGHRIEDHLAQHHVQVAALEVAQLRLVLDQNVDR